MASQVPPWSSAVVLAQIQYNLRQSSSAHETHLQPFIVAPWGLAPITQQCCNYTERSFLSQEGRKIVPGRKIAESGCVLGPMDLWSLVFLNMLDLGR